MPRIRFVQLIAALGAAGAFAPALQAADGSGVAAADTVTALHATLTAAMTRSTQLGCEGRIKLLQPAVETAFNLPFVAERTLRRSWKTLDAAQREQFTALLRSSFVTTYATEFAAPGAVSFATGSTEALANGDALVHSTLTPRGQGGITLDYVLRPQGNGAGSAWQVVNVLADGVSDLALRATQYDGLLKSEGFDALTAKLTAQTQMLKARCK